MVAQSPAISPSKWFDADTPLMANGKRWTYRMTLRLDFPSVIDDYTPAWRPV